MNEQHSTEKVAHRWGGMFVADCGARGGIRIAPNEARVTCSSCLALEADPADWAERDQFAAALRDVQAAASSPTARAGTDEQGA